MKKQDTLPLYFVSPWIDSLFIGGVSILTFALIFVFFGTGPTSPALLALAAGLTWVCNNPHFAATNYRLYHRQENRRQFPMTAYVVPVLVCAGMIASIHFPETVAPAFLKFFILWSPYHFSGQSVGLTMIYARRAGFQMGVWERRFFSGFIFSSFVAVLLKYEVSSGMAMEHFGIAYPRFGVPAWSLPVMHGILGFLGAGILYFVFKWSRANKRILPLIVLLPALTHFVWFLGGSHLSAFDEFVPFFHSAQYLFIAWAVQMKERSLERETTGVSKGFLFGESSKWFLLNILLGIALFEGLPYLFPLATIDRVAIAGIVSAGVQIHHFFVDGVIWKLRNSHNFSPLMSHIPSLVAKPSEVHEVEGDVQWVKA